MLFEDITSLSGSSSKNYSHKTTRRRSLHGSNIRPKHIPHRALRARHLRNNRFIRPRPLPNRRRLDSSDTISDMMDAISVSGGYTGGELFVKLQLDVSKVFAESIDALVRKPFDLLNNVGFMKNMFPSTDVNENEAAINSSVSFNAGAHATVRGG